MASSVYNVGTIRKILVCNFIFKCRGVHCSCTCFSSLCSGYGTCSKCFFFVYNLILIEEKMHVPVSVRFPDNAFNENMHMYCFHIWDFFPDIPFMTDTEIYRANLFWFLRKKETFACTVFSEIYYVTCTIQIDLPACLSAQLWLCRSHWQACLLDTIYIILYLIFLQMT